jgi:hypothetical protein
LRGIAPCRRHATTVGPYFDGSIHASAAVRSGEAPCREDQKIVPGITGRM